jgi:formylmethanofuran dehydrogenase subunit E
MNKTEALRSIHFDQLEYIQRKVWVDFDNERQQSVSFTFAGQTHQVGGIIGRFKMLAEQSPSGYLVEATDRNVFYLYQQLERVDRQHALEQGFWVLCFCIIGDNELMSWCLEDRKMLVNVSMKRVADFHGHICPELALGGKFCEFVQTLLATETIANPDLSIISENTTSALDAIQVLLGVTVGNQRLMVMDYGKHNYTLFSRHHDRGWKLKLKALYYGDEEAYHGLEDKITNNQAMLEDVVKFQQLLDSRVRLILELPLDELFAIEEVDANARPQESASVYLTCTVCGEQVLASRSVQKREKIFCLPCFQKMTPGCSQYGVQ